MESLHIKPPPRRVPSDDYAVQIEGVLYHPHAGEWVELVGTRSVGGLAAWASYQDLSVRIDEQQGEPNATRRILEIINQTFGEMCALIAHRIYAWNWTDDRSQPLPAPDGTGGPLQDLSAQELYYLITICQSEAPADRKNGSAPSLIISSDTPQPPTPKPSSTGRSRSKASSL